MRNGRRNTGGRDMENNSTLGNKYVLGSRNVFGDSPKYFQNWELDLMIMGRFPGMIGLILRICRKEKAFLDDKNFRVKNN